MATRLTAQLAALGANDQAAPAGGGALQWQGQVGLAPLTLNGRLSTQGLPLHLFSAYLDPDWGVHLQRGELSLQAELGARAAGAGWQLQAEGQARLAPLALLQTRQIDGARVVGEDLLRWRALQLDGIRLAIAPARAPTLSIRAATLDDAYARLIIDEQGRFNLREVRPAEARAATPAASASAPSLQLAVERTELHGGLVDFTDHFIRPNYSARLSELQGSLGSFATGQPTLAALSVRGKVAGTGQLEIDGRINPVGPLAMDLQANASDIELAPLSPYAAKYAGYAIERGKLSSRLHYQIEPGGALTASNQIVLNQLTFGERVESPSATTLPVRLALALLKDRDGVVDVNLPVRGSINDPEFSVGGIVWRLILNLIGKALTSPFSLFSGSEAAEEAQVGFAPGSAEPVDAQALDRIAKLLIDRPGVQLTLTGWADRAGEPQALRERRLDAALRAENVNTPEAALKRLYQASTLPGKPRNLIGLAKDLPPEQMRSLLLASYAVDDDSLRQLAVARAAAVRDGLLARGAPNARIFLAAPRLRDGCGTSPCSETWQPHVELTLAAH